MPMSTIHSRLEPSHNDRCKSNRKYNLTEIQAALELAEQIGTLAAAKATGIPYRRLVRFRLADRRSRQTLAEALIDLGRGRTRFWPKELALRVATIERARLVVRVEAAREGCQIAKRTGSSVWKCIEQAGNRRGLNGESLCHLVADGRIPKAWLI
jgi:hypothetical protein